MLAMTQSGHVAAAIRAANKNVKTELVEIVTTGDETVGPLLDVGGKGLFTEQLEDALRDGSIDMAVHSAKDVPTYLEDDLEISVVPLRADPRDALVTSNGLDLRELSGQAKVGTGSLRRRAQVMAWRSDVNVVPIPENSSTGRPFRYEKTAGGATLYELTTSGDKYNWMIYDLTVGEIK